MSYVHIFYNTAVGALANVAYIVVKKKLAMLAQMSQVAPEPSSLVMV